jgi:hypothetical protein
MLVLAIGLGIGGRHERENNGRADKKLTQLETPRTIQFHLNPRH